MTFQDKQRNIKALQGIIVFPTFNSINWLNSFATFFLE